MDYPPTGMSKGVFLTNFKSTISKIKRSAAHRGEAFKNRLVRTSGPRLSYLIGVTFLAAVLVGAALLEAVRTGVIKPESSEIHRSADDELALEAAEIAAAEAMAANRIYQNLNKETSDPNEGPTSELVPDVVETESIESMERFLAPEMLLPATPENSPILSVFKNLGLSETVFVEAQIPAENKFDLSEALIDSKDRISQDFKVPENMKERVGFWMEIYAKYNSNQHVIHHSLYPWIVYKVVDVSSIIESDSPPRLWMRRQKAEKVVKEELWKIRFALRKMANSRRPVELNELDHSILHALEPLGGSQRKQVLDAVYNVRVQSGQKNFFANGLEQGARYLPTMERIFAERNLPIELTRIPFVESSFNRHATSKVGAVGIWQFMEGTGRKFLMVNQEIDERNSPFKASSAAARLLKENYTILHRSWPLAVTAWNHGPSGIRRAIQAAGSRDLGKIVSRYNTRNFDFASSNFYAEFLAALHVERYSPEIFGLERSFRADELVETKLTRSLHFNELQSLCGIEAAELIAINPEMSKVAKANVSLPAGFGLYLPASALEGLQKVVSYKPFPRKFADQRIQ